ncbi:hypothetical protein L596_018584 [Steinernema carpocapsae]|uniref:Uncharacterized protein n=1 Tax=Steinernema carpocapsae TaxID=34508 RepID=A0A4U5N5K5_STECR|nr:hypothetical protein L596_018584 [Steinernema carpocapsae]
MQQREGEKIVVAWRTKKPERQIFSLALEESNSRIGVSSGFKKPRGAGGPVELLYRSNGLERSRTCGLTNRSNVAL